MVNADARGARPGLYSDRKGNCEFFVNFAVLWRNFGSALAARRRQVGGRSAAGRQAPDV